MRRPGLARVRVSGTMLWLEWPGRRGIRTRQIRVCRGRGPGGAVHGYRGRYLAKECVGSNRAVKRTIATSRSEATTTGTVPDNETKGRAQESPRPTNPRKSDASPTLPLRSQPRGKPLLLDKLFQEGHIDRQLLRDAIVAASPQISLPSDGWLGVAGEQFPAGCEVEWRKGHGRIARSGMGRHKTRRCAVGLKRRKRNDALSLGKKRCAVGSQLGLRA